jgi:Ser/Thr protein kinase RdoA (MazF antagonist)
MTHNGTGDMAAGHSEGPCHTEHCSAAVTTRTVAPVISRGALEALLIRHLRTSACPVVSPADPRVPNSLDCAEPFGCVLAQLHQALDDFTVVQDLSWTAVDPVRLMGDDAAWIERLYSHDPARGVVLAEWRERALEVVSEATGSDLGMCHGEAYPATCRHVDKGLAIAELGWAGEGDRAYDLATFRWALALHSRDDADRIFSEFLDGYAAVRKLPNLVALTAWVAARHLWSLRLGAGFVNEADLDRRADFATQWPIG